MKNFLVVIVLAFVFTTGLSVGIYLGFSGGSALEVEVDPDSDGLSKDPKVLISSEPFGTSIFVPAVDNEGKGVITELFVDVKDGSGQVLVDVNQILFWVDTQFSIRTAKNVAEDYTGITLENKDIRYGIRTEADLIEGPSAGAALAIVTIAALKSTTLSGDIMITGTVEPDGTIGPIGGVLEKAKASRDAGATLFLVPEGQSLLRRYIPQTSCQQIGSFKFCNTKFVREEVNIEEQAGIDVKEVKNVEDAARIFGL